MNSLMKIAITLILALGAVSSSYASLGGDCNPVAVDACGLPFPSDLFKDEITGKLDFDNAILDKRVTGTVRTGTSTLASQFAEKFTPASIFNGSTGYSPLGPVLFELPSWPRDAIPANGAGVLRVFDMQSGEEVPMVVSLSRIANSDRDLVREKSPVIIAWPQTRFISEHQYVAVLLKGVYNQKNVQMQPVKRMKVALGLYAVYPNSVADQLKKAYAPAVAFLATKSIDKSKILAATYFSIKSEDEVTQPMLSMLAEAKQITPRISGLKSREEFGSTDYGAGTLTGNVQLVNFRSEDGGVYPPYKPVDDSSKEQTDFILTLPKWDQTGPVPIVVRGHGVGNDKTATRGVSIRNDELGMATIAVDFPNHGSRITNQSPYIGNLVHDPKNIMQLLGMFVQGAIDQSVVINAAVRSLPAAVAKVPNMPSLDGERVAYYGVSMGAMIGSTVGGLNPDLKGAYLVNGSGALMQTFSESYFWDGNTGDVIPTNANGAEATFVLAMMQHYLDIADGLNFANYYRNPLGSSSPIRLGMQYSIADGNVPNNASLALAELVDLPLLKGGAFQAEPRLRYGASGRAGFEDNGFGILQTSYGLDYADDAVEELKGFDSSIDFAALDQFKTVLDAANKLGLDLSKYTALTDLLSATGVMLSNTAVGNINDIIDKFYNGDTRAFLTHFNTSPPFAAKVSIDWYCGLLDLDFSRCENARKLVDENASNPSTGGPENPTDNIPGKDDIDKAIQDGKDMLNDLKVEVNNGSGGSIDGSESGLFALLLLLRLRGQRAKKLVLELMHRPSFRVLGSAVASAVTWGGWAFIANMVKSEQEDSLLRAIYSGAAQATSSFVMTVIASILLEYLFARLECFRFRNVMTVLAVTSLSLSAMIAVHLAVNTPRIVLTILPIYTVVVLYCSAYVKTLEALKKPAVQMAK